MRKKYLWRLGLAFGLSLWVTLQTVFTVPTQVPPQIAAAFPSARVAAAEPLLQQGLDQYQNGRYQQALLFWQQAQAQFEQQPNPVQAALTDHYIALAQQQLGQLGAAQSSIKAGLSRLTQNPELPQSLAVKARLLNTQGSLSLATGQATDALISWQNAEQLYRQQLDPVGVAGSLINQSQAEQSLGYFTRARSTLKLAEADWQKEPDPKSRLIMALSLGNVLGQIGELETAQSLLKSALSLAEAEGLQADTAPLLMSLGKTQQSLGLYAQAQESYQQATEVSDRPKTKIEASLNQFNLFIEQQRWADAQSFWPFIKLMITQDLNDRERLLHQLNLAHSLLKLHAATGTPTVGTIAADLSEADRFAQQLQDPRSRSFALGYLGTLYESTAQWPEAEQLTRQALRLAQQANATGSQYRWQWQLGRLLRQQGQLAEAKVAYGSAIDILQTLRQNLVSISVDVQYSFRDEVEPVYREYVDLLLTAQPETALTQETLRQARSVMELLRLAELDFFLRSTCLDTSPESLEKLLEPGTAVLYPIVLNERIVTLLSLPDGSLQLFSSPVPAIELEALVEALRIALEKPYTAPEGRAYGLTLYQALIAPLQATLTQHQIQTLVFVPDDVLQNVPLAVLYDGDRYLIEQYQISIAPGMKLLPPVARAAARPRALAAGLSNARPGFSPLSFVPVELRAILNYLPGKILLNEQFTSRAISGKITDAAYSVVHLATHGQFSSKVDQTFILAWDRPIDLYELKSIIEQRPFGRDRRAIDLLVLSACETAAGDSRAALGLAGMAVQSGASSTLATLWTVDDESSSLFMEQFYAALAQPGTTKAIALHTAQQALLRDPDYRHPFHWAPYVLIGNWR